MLCGKCGAQVGDDFKFCPECGTPMPVVRKAAEKALNQGEEPLEKVKAEADKAGIPMDPQEFHCKGEFKGVHKGRPNEEDLKAAAEFAKKIVG